MNAHMVIKLSYRPFAKCQTNSSFSFLLPWIESDVYSYIQTLSRHIIAWPQADGLDRFMTLEWPSSPHHIHSLSLSRHISVWPQADGLDRFMTLEWPSSPHRIHSLSLSRHISVWLQANGLDRVITLEWPPSPHHTVCRTVSTFKCSSLSPRVCHLWIPSFSEHWIPSLSEHWIPSVHCLSTGFLLIEHRIPSLPVVQERPHSLHAVCAQVQISGEKKPRTMTKNQH